MKNSLIVLAFLFLSSVALQAQTNDPATALLGKWKIDAGSLDKFIDAQIAMRAKQNPGQETPPEMKEMMKASVELTVWEYVKDGRFLIHPAQGPVIEGTWSLSADKQWVITNLPGQGETKRKIESIAKSTLTVSYEALNVSVTFVPVG